MKKITFKNAPSTETPLSAENLNLMQNNAEEEITRLENLITEKIKQAKLAMYPVGAIYLSMTEINPSTFLGGTWVQIAKGRTLIGVDSADADFAAPNKQGGEKTHKLTTEEIPAHTHEMIPFVDIREGDMRFEISNSMGSVIGGKIRQVGVPVSRTGGDQPHNNLQPYLTCYIWQRTA